MQLSRHSSRASMELTAFLLSPGIVGVLAVATCTGGVSGGTISDELVNTDSAIDFGSFEAAGLSVGIPLTSSATLVTSTLPRPALPIAASCGASVSFKSAVQNGA